MSGYGIGYGRNDDEATPKQMAQIAQGELAAGIKDKLWRAVWTQFQSQLDAVKGNPEKGAALADEIQNFVDEVVNSAAKDMGKKYVEAVNNPRSRDDR